MSLKRLILSTLLIGVCGSALADANLDGKWAMKLDANGYPPRGARNLPLTMDIKQKGGKIDIDTVHRGGDKTHYACALPGRCVVGTDQREWWVRWDGAELVMELRSGREKPQTLHRLYLTPDKQNLLLRSIDDPQAFTTLYDKQK